MKRILVALAISLILITGCGNQQNNQGTLSERDMKILSTITYGQRVESLIQFLYSTPTLDEFNAFVKDYDIASDFLDKLRDSFKKIDTKTRTKTDVAVNAKGYNIDKDQISLFYDITVSNSMYNTRVTVFVDSDQGQIKSIEGYAVQ